ncbi:diguanylate cyclase/phosphodiesterase (GGDEF & EAL domains) with PAS/PAC sensor(s), partial [hydrothermal vent metagenome]
MEKINFRLWVLGPFTLALVLLLGAFIFNSFLTHKKDLEDTSYSTSLSVLKLFEEKLRSDAEVMEVAMKFILADKKLQAAMRSGDRNALMAAGRPIYHDLKQNQRITHFYVRDEKRVTKIRMNRPDDYGDTINRVTTLRAEKTQQMVYGLELGKVGYLTLRMVSPWMIDGKLAGYVELGKEIENIIGELKKIIGVEVAVTIKKKYLDRAKWEKGMLALGRNHDWDIFSESVIVSSTLSILPKKLRRVLSAHKEAFSETPRIKNSLSEISYKGKYYDVSMVSLSDIAGKNVASMVILRDISAESAADFTSVLLIIAICLFVGAVLFILFYIILSKVEVWLEKSQKELKEAKEKLEVRVVERTKELSVANERLRLEIEDRKQAENETKRLAAVVEQAAEMVMVTDKDGVIQYVNPAFENVTGYDRREVVGKKPDIIASGKHDEAFYQTLWNTISSGKVWRGRFINKKKDGSLFDSDGVISPIRGEGGAIVNYVSLQRDVTDDLKLERKLRSSQKMEAIGTLAGGIAHDFNNILTSIIAYAELAHNDLKEGSEAKGNLDAALKAGTRAKELVAEILAFSRDGERAVSPVYVQAVVRDTLNILRPIIPSTVSIRENINDNLPPVMAHRTHLTQVVMNLCTNAEHSMRENGGVLDISLEGFEVDEDFALLYSTVSPGSYVRLTISDEGHGMDKETAERVFEPFFTTKKVGEGTGMGLSVVHGIVRDHGGLITVYSEPGQGTTFSVYLPILEGI